MIMVGFAEQMGFDAQKLGFNGFNGLTNRIGGVTSKGWGLNGISPI